MDNNKSEREPSYPKPSESDSQFKQQGEFIQRQSSRLSEQVSGNDSQQDMQEMKDKEKKDTTEGIP